MHRTKNASPRALSLITASCLFWMYSSAISASPSVGAPASFPSAIQATQPVELTVTAQISGDAAHPVIPTGVNLLRVDGANKVMRIVGTMRDDGTNGDEVAGDKVFTLQFTTTEPAAGELRLQVSAAFQRQLRRVLSPVTSVSVLPRIPPPTVEVDSTLQGEVSHIPGFDGEPDRAVAVLTDHSGLPMHFVANELVVVADDVAAAVEIAARLGGTLVRSVVPADFGIKAPGWHLVRIDPKTADRQQLVSDLAQLEPDASGHLRVSSEAALGLLAAAARESAEGRTVTPNIVMLPAGFRDRTTTEHPSLPLCTTDTNPPGCVLGGIMNPNDNTQESFNTNAFTWSYMGTGPGTQDIGVGEAWRLLDGAGLLGNRIKIAVIDGGFAPSVDNPLKWEHRNNSISVTGFPANELLCNNRPCPWHGTNVVSALMGRVDDGQGAAGPAGPVARALTIRLSGDIFNYMGAWLIAFTSGAKVLNMSFGARVPAILTWAVRPLDHATALAHDEGMLLVAAAGNQRADVDAKDCAPPFGFPCWEEAWWVPCENRGVLCVGGLADNSDRRAILFSNFGAEQVRLFAPGAVWVGPDPASPEPRRVQGTSFASPFVAGVGALVMAANPALSAAQVEQTLLQTAHTSPDPTVRRYVNAEAAVLEALGGGPICKAPEITFATPSGPSAPCARRFFGVGHTEDFGPFSYVWRKYEGGSLLELADGANISGSATKTMVIDPFLPSDAGVYDVLVTNLCGTTPSPLFQATVTDGALEPAPILPSEREFHSMSYDRRRGRMVLFGGGLQVRDGDGRRQEFRVSGETWERDANGIWHYVTNHGPSPRYSAQMAYDEARGVTVLFGGFLCPSFYCKPGTPDFPGARGEVYGDTWEWDGSTWTQKFPAAAPAPRAGHAMAYDPVRQRVVVFGGQDRFGSALGDFWEWDGSTWAEIPTFSDSRGFGHPGRLSGHSLAFDRSRNAYVLHSGGVISRPGLHGATWDLGIFATGAGTFGRWTLRHTPNPNTELSSHSLGLAYDEDMQRILLYTTWVFNSPEGQVRRGRLWEFGEADSGEGEWRPITEVPYRSGSRIAYDRERKRTVIAGGNRITAATARVLFPEVTTRDVWEWRYFLPDPTCSLGRQ